MNCYDGGCDILSAVYDLVNSGYSLGDAHTGNASKMESFEGHLSGRFANTLCSKGPDCLSWLDECFMEFFDKDIEEESNLFVSDSIETVLHIFFIPFHLNLTVFSIFIVFFQILGFTLKIFLYFPHKIMQQLHLFLKNSQNLFLLELLTVFLAYCTDFLRTEVFLGLPVTAQ